MFCVYMIKLLRKKETTGRKKKKEKKKRYDIKKIYITNLI